MTDTEICCDVDFEGCGVRAPYDSNDCPGCNRKLWTAQKQFYLGQDIYFYRNDLGVPTSGKVVDIADTNGDYCIKNRPNVIGAPETDPNNWVRIRYNENQFKYPSYDEFHVLSKVFNSLEDAISNMGTRSRSRTSLSNGTNEKSSSLRLSHDSKGRGKVHSSLMEEISVKKKCSTSSTVNIYSSTSPEVFENGETDEKIESKRMKTDTSRNVNEVKKRKTEQSAHLYDCETVVTYIYVYI
jgi:hypothetical protein